MRETYAMNIENMIPVKDINRYILELIKSLKRYSNIIATTAVTN